MSNLSWNEIQDRATEFASKWQNPTTISSERGEAQSFWSDFLHIYGVDRRRHGAFFEYAIKKSGGKQGYIDMFWPGKLLAEQKAPGRDLDKATIQAYEYLETMPDHDLPHAIVVSDFTSFEFIDLETREKSTIALSDLPKHVKLFAFLIEQKSQKLAEENPVNVKAAEAMASIHNQLKDDNYTGHDLEVLLVRLVFCMFADDSGIFDHQALRQYLIERTHDDGSDLGPRLMQIFQVLNTPRDQRQSSLDETIASLPYVNGGLFAEDIRTPYFRRTMRGELLVAMELDWSKVSPAIFGSMFQGVMDAKERRNLGAHYTSEKNILRVIKPLFLDDLYDEFAAALASGPRKKYDELRKLQDKLAGLKFLDPACGAGNFLVITYRELRRLEHKIVAQLAKNRDQQDMFASAGSGVGSLKVNVDQMYGIEIEEFPSLIARTALWLTDHQMNMEFSRESGRTFKRLPLTASATIVNDNALTIDWADVVSRYELDYILGNPPFLGQTYQNKEQKEQVGAALSGIKKTGVLDFVSAWYGKATDFMARNTKIQTALVSTNSITQGEQVSILWKYLLDKGVRINFAHRTFKWTNDARGVAAVHCVIIGFALFDRKEKQLFEYTDIKADPIDVAAKNINPYLVDAPDIIVSSRTKALSQAPTMSWGNKPVDGGYLILDDSEKLELTIKEPQSAKYIKKLIDARSFLHNENRWCLWLVNANPTDLRNMPMVMNRIKSVQAARLNSRDEGARRLAERPALFRDTKNPTHFLVIPSITSENRDYIPIGFFDENTIANNRLHMIIDATPYDFGILTSRIHMAWVRAVAGRLKSDYSYSKDIVYNNFIWPDTTDEQKAHIETLAQAVLDARAEFPNASLADLYDPLTMPPVLAKAHKTLDRAVDKLYSNNPFATDAERVALLFEKYKEITNGSK